VAIEIPYPCRRALLGSALSVLAGSLAGVAPAWARGSLVELIAQSKPSVVSVGVFNPLASPRFSPRGTGFVVGDGNLVVTNAHVVPEDLDRTYGAQLRVRVVSGPAAPSERIATIVRVDAAHDLALLQIDGTRLPALRLASGQDVDEGTEVALIGFPISNLLGLAPVTHRGIVSAVTDMVLPPPNVRQLSNRAIQQLRTAPFKIYQLDATAYPGNSGGPLFDLGTREVIGVVSMVAIKSTRESALSDPTGISYAMPIRWVHELLAAGGQRP
jgi:serine protease Do